MKTSEQALKLLPEELGVEIKSVGEPEEIRLRLGRKPTAVYNGGEQEIGSKTVSETAIRKILERATGASLYSHSGELRHGYINYHGLRIGVCGDAVLQDNTVTGFRTISSLNIRIPREMHGICRPVLDRLRKNGEDSTLIVSPPGGGKTTALRELIRCLSDDGHRISVIDERGELSAADSGINGFDLGSHSDVLLNVPKGEGALMLLRSMNPEYIAMDEITSPADLESIMTIIGCGVRLLATAHGSCPDELGRRPLYAKLLAMDVFRYIVTVSCKNSVRSYMVDEI